MSEHRPVTITSPTHPVALAAYFAQVALAAQLVEGIATTRALDSAIGTASAWAVPLLMFAAGLGVIVAAIVVSRLPEPTDALRLEAWCVFILGVVSAAYALSLTLAYGWAGGATTQTYSWALAAGFIWRAWQAWRERCRLRRASAAAVPADPPPLGEPDTREG